MLILYMIVLGLSPAKLFCFTPLPGVSEAKPGSCVQPYLGVRPALVDDVTGELVEGSPAEGALVVEGAWPSMTPTGTHPCLR